MRYNVVKGIKAPNKTNLGGNIMNKNTFKTVKLGKGEANVYNFGEVKLHA